MFVAALLGLTTLDNVAQMGVQVTSMTENSPEQPDYNASILLALGAIVLMNLMTRNSVQLLLQRFVYAVTARMWDFVAYALSFLALQEDAPMDVDHEGPASVTSFQYASICPEGHMLMDVKFMGAENNPPQPGYRNVLPNAVRRTHPWPMLDKSSDMVC